MDKKNIIKSNNYYSNIKEMREQLNIFKFNENTYNEYVGLINNKKFNDINKKINKFLKNVLDETIILVERNEIGKYIEEFNKIQSKILLYSDKLSYTPSKINDIKMKVPLLKKKAEEEYLMDLKKNFDLNVIKDDLVEMFSIVELTVLHISEITSFYQDYEKQLNFLIEKIKKLSDLTEKEKAKIKEDSNDYIFFQELEINLKNILSSYIELRTKISIFVRRLTDLSKLLDYSNKRFKKVFKELINFRSNLIKGKLKNNILINQHKLLIENLKKIKNNTKKKLSN